MSSTNSRLWAIILGAGEGRRLADVAALLHGRPVPKQFIQFGTGTLLGRTLERLAPTIPAERTVVVVNAEWADVARQQLEAWPGAELVPQPANLDTATGLLLPLAHVLCRCPDAVVAVFPCDHHFDCPKVLCNAVNGVAEQLRGCGDRLALLGATPESPETDYGWIVPGPVVTEATPGGLPELRAVHRFVEKPSADEAARLMACGGLWNTMICIAGLRTFLAVLRRHLPEHTSLFQGYALALRDGPAERLLRSIYRCLPPANLSRGVLEKNVRHLAVVKLPACGWSDLGTRERLERSLDLPELRR